MTEFPPDFSLSRRLVLLTALGFGLSACSETIDTVVSDLDFSSEDDEGVPISRAKVDSIPYASIAAKIGNADKSLIVLGRVNQSELHWITADRISLVTRQGRLVQTAGLPSNLRRTELLGPDPLAALGGGRLPAASARLQRLVDLEPPQRYGIMIRSAYEDLGPAAVVIAELEFDTRHVREINETREFDWRFENEYWVDPEHGIVWKSRQHIHPDLPPVEIDLLKPAAV